ncbi:CBM96 family carbohydrate-binding protein [Dyadobacter sandarakinus]|uniref:DNRLRE domain-containing protein n=1 Tax=Dyadobacter sandarakinus TaxID=2747268 RepID=A0ABX7I5Q2_9BACT|nr:DNRLRE domain-containing protein [Dyadobacter sandarakinus]QRR00822.1 DNRLRE domain-containing protein [Dyadobacter sandarakinus]
MSLFAQPAIEWEKIINAPSNGYTYMWVVTETPDGGYIVGGQADGGIGGDKTAPNKGSTDYWVIKLRADRTVEWDKTFGGSREDELKEIVLTADGGYLLGGNSNSDAGFDKSEDCKGGYSESGMPPDYWIVKISANGTKQWDKTYGGLGEDYFKTIQLTSDGGYILGGGAKRGYNIIKLRSDGSVDWERTYVGADGFSPFGTIKQTADNGYIIVGYSEDGVGFDKTQPSKGSYDYWIIKVDASGTVLWDKVYGGSDYDTAQDVTELSNGKYLVTGSSNSPISGDKTENPFTPGALESWILMLNADGSLAWENRIGNGRLSFFEEKENGHIVLAGIASANPDKTENSTSAWIVTVDNNGSIVSNLSLPSTGYNFRRTSDSGFVLFSDTYRFTKFANPQPPLPQTTLRINAGGPDFTTATKKLFIADKYYAGTDRTSSIASGDILGTTNNVLYRSARSAPSFSYNIPVGSGQVNVTLHFAETYFGVPGTKGEKGGTGSRRFHVNMEGSRKLTNYDIFSAAGGAMRANQITFPVTVTDGVLNIDFLTGAADQPRVCAIEVVPVSVTLTPVADAYVRGGSYSATNFGLTSSLEVKSLSTDPAVRRASYLKFQLPAQTPVVSAKLRVYGRNHENTKPISLHAYGVDTDSWTEAGITQSNAPATSTVSLGFAAVTDVYQYYEIDVTSYVKAQQQSGETLVSLLLNDPNNRNTRVIFNSKEAGSNPPQLVIQVTNSAARLSQEEVLSEVQEKQPSSIFPNPVKDHFTVSLSPNHGANISFEMVNAAGKSHSIPAPQNVKPGESAEFNIAGQLFQTGIYLLKVKSDAFTEVIRVLKAE